MRQLTHHPWFQPLVFCLLGVALSLAAGVALLPLETAFAPLLVAALLPALALLCNPRAALYLAYFIKFLPAGLIDGDLHSPLSNLALLLALAAWITRLLIERRPVRLPLAVLLLGLVILLHFVSITWAPDADLARSELVQWVLVLLLLLVTLNVVDTPEALTGLMRVIALNGWVLVMAGIATVLSGGYISGERLQVFETNANGYGIALLTSFAGVLWLAVRPGPRQYLASLLCALYIPLAGVLIVFTGSRGGLLSFVLVLALLMLLPRSRPWGLYAVLLGLVALVAMPTLFSSITNRLSNPEESLSGDRELLWQASADLILDHPWGVGAGYGPTALHDYILRYTPNYADRATLPSHNPILEIGIDTGLLGMLLYVTMLAVVSWGFVGAFRRTLTNDDRQWLPYFAVVGAVVVGYVTSWIKSGGVYYDDIFIRQLALLLLPACAPFFWPAPLAPRAEGQP